MSSYNRFNRSNGLSKSSSQPNYLIPYELNDYNQVYLPLIKLNQQAEILSNKIDKTNRIKDEILASKYKLYYNRGIDNYHKNKFKDSWNNFFKRREREKQRNKIYKIIKDEPYISSEEEDDEIFRPRLNYRPNKIEDKIKLKQYLPAKRDLAKLMFKVNDNINDRIDKNSYLFSKNIINLENGYGELKNMVEHKINKLERKQEEDFYDLRSYFNRRAQRERDKYDNNKLILENGNDTYQVNYDKEDGYYKPNMKENIGKLQTYEIAKKIQKIPYLLDDMIKNIENIRIQRKNEKNDFLLNFNKQINENNANIYDNIDDDFISDRYNDYNYNYNYNLDKYDNSFMGFGDTFSSMKTPYYNYRYKPSKPRTEYKRNIKKDVLSMSKSDIANLKTNLKPLSHQTPKNKKINLNDNDDSITAEDLKEIYKQKNANKNSLKKSNEINIKENKTFNKLKESQEKKETNKNNKEESDNDVVVVENDDDKSKTQKKETNNEEKEKEKEKKEENKENNNNAEKKEEAKNKIEKKEDNSDDEKDDNGQSENDVGKESNNDDDNDENDENKDGN